MTMQPLTDTALQIDWCCRDIGYGIEEGSGVYIYRGREQYGKYTFEDVDSGDLIYLFEDEIASMSEPLHRKLYTVTLNVWVKPKVATWERFAFTPRHAERSAVDAAEREWPTAAKITANAEDSVVSVEP